MKAMPITGNKTYLYKNIYAVLNNIKKKSKQKIIIINYFFLSNNLTFCLEIVDDNKTSAYPSNCRRVFIVLTDGLDNDEEEERKHHKGEIVRLLDEMKSPNFNFKLFLIGKIIIKLAYYIQIA